MITLPTTAFSDIENIITNIINDTAPIFLMVIGVGLAFYIIKGVISTFSEHTIWNKPDIK
jgi:hypothetical protein